MRVLINCLSAISGGAKAYLRNISGPLHLEFLNHNMHRLFFLACEEQLEILFDIPSENIILINGDRPLGLFRFVWEKFSLPRIVADFDIDVLFTPYQVGPNIRGVKNVLMIRNMEPFFFFKYRYSMNTWLRNKVLSFISNHCLRKADRIIAVSKFAAGHLEDLGIPNQSISLIYHGSPTFFKDSSNDLFELANLGINNPFVLACGSILPYRRYEDVIHAFNRALPSIPDNVILVIVGSGSDIGYKRMLADIIAQSPQPERIFMLGAVQWSDMDLLYRNGCCCIITSEIEACPNIAIEAMASGSCILAAEIPPLPEILDDCAIFFPPRNVSLLSKSIASFILDENNRNHFSLRSRKRTISFSWSVSAAKTYNALIDWNSN